MQTCFGTPFRIRQGSPLIPFLDNPRLFFRI